MFFASFIARKKKFWKKKKKEYWIIYGAEYKGQHFPHHWEKERENERQEKARPSRPTRRFE